MKFRDLLADLGNHIGLGALQPDDNGACRLVFDGETEVDLELDANDENVLHLHTVVGVTPPEERVSFYLRLLEGNFLGQQTGGAVLALDPGTDEVVLSRRADIAGCEAEVLGDALGAFVHTARDWKARILAAPGTGSGGGDGPAVSGMMRV